MNTLKDVSWLNEDEEWVSLEETGYEYRNEVIDEIMFFQTCQLS